MPTPITVTANLIDLTGSTINGSMTASVITTSGKYDLYVAGTGIIVPRSSTSSVGSTVSLSLWGNDVILDNSNGANDSFYTITIFNASNIAIWTASYTFTGSGTINLVGYPPLTTFPIPSGAVPTNILTSNNVFTGTNAFNGNVTHSATETFGGPTIFNANITVTNILSSMAGSGSIGTSLLPFNSVTIGNAASTGTSLTSAALAMRTVAFPDAAGNVILDTAIQTLTNKTLNTPLPSGTGLQIFNTTTTCTTAASAGATCTTAAISLPVAEADTSYRVTCTGKGITNVPVVIATANSSATQFTITIAALTAAAATFTSYDCIAGHN